MKRDYLFHTFFLADFVLLLYVFARIIEPFLTPILGALVLVILAMPIHRRLEGLCTRRSPNFTAALSTIAVAIAIIGPFLLVSWLLYMESQSMGPALQEWGHTLKEWRETQSLLAIPWIGKLGKTLRDSIGIGQVDFERFVVAAGREFFAVVSSAGRMLARNLVVSIGHMLVMLFTLFFLFRDGEQLFVATKRLIPMRVEHKDRIAERLRVTVTAIVRGSILTALFQMVTAMVGYLIAGVPAAVSLGVATGIAAFVPFVGTALVWLPLGITQLLQGHTTRGLIVLGWSAALVATLDNVLRTYLVGRKAELPILFLFFAIIGGLSVYGLRGLLVGPLLVAIIPVFVDIYRDQFLRKELPEAVDDHPHDA